MFNKILLFFVVVFISKCVHCSETVFIGNNLLSGGAPEQMSVSKAHELRQRLLQNNGITLEL